MGAIVNETFWSGMDNIILEKYWSVIIKLIFKAISPLQKIG